MQCQGISPSVSPSICVNWLATLLGVHYEAADRLEFLMLVMVFTYVKVPQLESDVVGEVGIECSDLGSANHGRIGNIIRPRERCCPRDLSQLPHNVV